MDIETLAAAAAELADRLHYLATAEALPGDSAVRWLEHRAESLQLLEQLGGLHLIATPL